MYCVLDAFSCNLLTLIHGHTPSIQSDTLHTLCLKNDTGVTHYNFDADQPILIILADLLLREYAVTR